MHKDQQQILDNAISNLTLKGQQIAQKTSFILISDKNYCAAASYICKADRRKNHWKKFNLDQNKPIIIVNTSSCKHSKKLAVFLAHELVHYYYHEMLTSSKRKKTKELAIKDPAYNNYVQFLKANYPHKKYSSKWWSEMVAYLYTPIFLGKKGR